MEKNKGTSEGDTTRVLKSCVTGQEQCIEPNLSRDEGVSPFESLSPNSMVDHLEGQE